ncbi:hypothetical protein GCM10023238_10280 [Streptomyces heliomycini]
MLNEALNVVEAMEFERGRDIVTLRRSSRTASGPWCSGTPTRNGWCGSPSRCWTSPSPGDALHMEPAPDTLRGRPQERVEELVLEEVPDIGYEQIGGLGGQIEAIRGRASSCPISTRILFQGALNCDRPRDVLLYGPPGCGKTLIARGRRQLVAKKVAEVTGQAAGKRLLPQHQGPRAAEQVRRRDRAADPPGLPAGPGEGQRGHPVIVFFDE